MKNDLRFDLQVLITLSNLSTTELLAIKDEINKRAQKLIAVENNSRRHFLAVSEKLNSLRSDIRRVKLRIKNLNYLLSLYRTKSIERDVFDFGIENKHRKSIKETIRHHKVLVAAIKTLEKERKMLIVDFNKKHTPKSKRGATNE